MSKLWCSLSARNTQMSDLRGQSMTHRLPLDFTKLGEASRLRRRKSCWSFRLPFQLRSQSFCRETLTSALLLLPSTPASAKIGIRLQIGPVNVRDSWILSSHLRQMSFTFSRV